MASGAGRYIDPSLRVNFTGNRTRDPESAFLHGASRKADAGGSSASALLVGVVVAIVAFPIWVVLAIIGGASRSTGRRRRRW